MNTTDNHATRFDVAFTFPSESRDIVREIATAVGDVLGREKVYFDEWFEAELLGVDADLKLQRVFRDDSRLVVFCIGGAYDKPWNQIEWRALRNLWLERQESDRMRLLPLRVGDGEITGILQTAIIPDVRNRDAKEISDLILARLELIGKNGALEPTLRDDSNVPKETTPVAQESREVFVSYSWRYDSTEPIVDELCSAIQGSGIEIIRDKTHVDSGSRISRFMDRLGRGGCIIVVLSDEYLKSEYCMYELFRIYVMANHDDDRFLERVIPLVDGDIKISKPIDRIKYAAYWKKERDELDAAAKEYGPDVMGNEDYKTLRRMSEFVVYVSDMLAYLNDKCMPRQVNEVKADNFGVVRSLVSRAVGGHVG